MYCLEIADEQSVVGFEVIIKIENWGQHGYFVPVEKITKVSAHGDLIDRDAIFNNVKFPFNSFTVANGERVVSCDYLNAAPTIVPASGGDSK